MKENPYATAHGGSHRSLSMPNKQTKKIPKILFFLPPGNLYRNQILTILLNFPIGIWNPSHNEQSGRMTNGNKETDAGKVREEMCMQIVHNTCAQGGRMRPTFSDGNTF